MRSLIGCLLVETKCFSTSTQWNVRSECVKVIFLEILLHLKLNTLFSYLFFFFQLLAVLGGRPALCLRWTRCCNCAGESRILTALHDITDIFWPKLSSELQSCRSWPLRISPLPSLLHMWACIHPGCPQQNDETSSHIKKSSAAMQHVPGLNISPAVKNLNPVLYVLKHTCLLLI